MLIACVVVRTLFVRCWGVVFGYCFVLMCFRLIVLIIPLEFHLLVFVAGLVVCLLFVVRIGWVVC